MNKVFNFSVALALVLMTSCEKEVKLSPFFSERKLVIQSLISPQDTLLRVNVSVTKPIVGGSDSTRLWIDDAEVIISDDQQKILLTYSGSGVYSYRLGSKFGIHPNKTYELQVKTPDGQSVRSFCKVPSVPFDIGDITVEKKVIDVQKFQLSINWPIRSNSKNIFGLWSGFEKINTRCGSAPTNYISYSGNDNTLGQFTTGLFFNECNPGKSAIVVKISVFDENFYDFYKTLDQQINTNGIPFTEPSQLFTNIEGGYGIFSAHYTFTKLI